MDHAGSTRLRVGVWRAPDVSHDHLPRDDYVSLGAWKRALRYVVQSETQMYGIQITTINNHKAKN